MMSSDDRMFLFSQGRQVSFLLPLLASTMRPSREQLKVVAKAMGISQRQARKALDFFNFEGN